MVATFLPATWLMFVIAELSIPVSVNVLAIPATIVVAKIIEITIQLPAITLPQKVTGARSPYPVVDMVTIASHIPFAMPGAGSGGNCSGDAFRSASQIKVPTMARMNKKTNMAISSRLLKNGAILSSMPLFSIRDIIDKLD